MSSFLAAASPEFHRLLFFLRPTPEASEQIEHAKRKWREYGLGLTGKVVPSDRHHCTVGHVIDSIEYPAGLVPVLRRVGKRAAASSSPIQLVLERIFTIGIDGNRPIALGGPGLAGINLARRKVLSALQAEGIDFARELKSAPHLTVQYQNQLVIDRPIEPISWRASELVLVDSLVGLTRHVELGRWQFEGAEQLSLPF